jgi:hypothetical protein
LDWFAPDALGHLAHFATGGRGPVPQHATLTQQRLLNNFFRALPIRSEVQEAAGWDTHAGIPKGNARRRKLYLDDYASMSSRGLYSYSVPASWDSSVYYFCVTKPSTTPLLVTDLPTEIRALLLSSGYVLPLNLGQASVIDLDELGDVVS